MGRACTCGRSMASTVAPTLWCQQMWTVIQRHGPDHLGVWLSGPNHLPPATAAAACSAPSGLPASCETNHAVRQHHREKGRAFWLPKQCAFFHETAAPREKAGYLAPKTVPFFNETAAPQGKAGVLAPKAVPFVHGVAAPQRKGQLRKQCLSSPPPSPASAARSPASPDNGDAA